MGRVAAIAGGLLGALAFVAGAQAADPPRSWPREEITPASPYRELASGWYVRADIGYRLYGGGPSFSAVTRENYTNGFNGTLGFGFKYQWFRTDLTYDRGTPTRVSVSTSSPVGQPQIGAKVRPETVLANAYVDLGTWWGFTPYVGAGAGVSRLESKNYSDTTTAPPEGGWARGRSHNFAWAAMGGVAMQISPRWMIDVGYRYLSLGDAASTDETVPSNGAVSPFFKNITTHEARVGVRFLLD